MQGTEEDLIYRAQKGDRRAFEQLIYKYDRQVLNIAASFRNSEEDAHDIYQEVFIRVYKGLKSFEFRSEFSTWLFRIATNVCISYERSKKRHQADSLDRQIKNEDDRMSLSEILPSDSNSENYTISNEIKLKLEEATSSLPPQQKLAFTLKYYQGYKIKEIADIMNCSDGTIKRYLFNATNKLREYLSDLI